MEDKAGDAACFSLASLVPYTGLVVLLTYMSSVFSWLGCYGILILVPALVAFFFGGLFFNFVTWGVISMALLRNPAGACCTCPCFFVCSFIIYLAVGTGSPVLRSWEIESLEPMEHVGLCTDVWRDFKGSIYFEDGSLSEDDKMPQAFPINVPRCYAKHHKNSKTEWFDCHFMVRPVFQCDGSRHYEVSDACEEPRACAWAITGSTWDVPSPPEKPECLPGRGLCGFRTMAEIMVPPITESSKHTFQKELQAAGKQFPGNLTGESPLLDLVNPEEEAASLRFWRPVYYLLLFLYVPLGALASLVRAAFELCGGSAIQCSWNPSDDSSPFSSPEDE